MNREQIGIHAAGIEPPRLPPDNIAITLSHMPIKRYLRFGLTQQRLIKISCRKACTLRADCVGNEPLPERRWILAFKMAGVSVTLQPFFLCYMLLDDIVHFHGFRRIDHQFISPRFSFIGLMYYSETDHI